MIARQPSKVARASYSATRMPGVPDNAESRRKNRNHRQNSVFSNEILKKLQGETEADDLTSERAHKIAAADCGHRHIRWWQSAAYAIGDQ